MHKKISMIFITQFIILYMNHILVQTHERNVGMVMRLIAY